MIFLILTVLSSTSIGLILKHNSSRRGEVFSMLGGNYLMACVISLILILSEFSSFEVPSGATILGGVSLGVLFLLSFFAFSRTVEIAGAASASVFSRLSVIIPIVLSIIFFNETPGMLRLVGFAMALFSIILFYFSMKDKKNRKDPGRIFIFPLVLMFGIGMNDFSLKLFNQFNPSSMEAPFVFLIFSSAASFSFMWMKVTSICIDRKSFFTGLFLGIPNVFSTYFLIKALKVMDGSIVYSVSNISIIVLTTLLANIIWQEKPDKWGFMALFSGTVGIILISIS
ncbi:MAG: EamA family transporter [Deltaproteobacteria bacterium]|nr:EamA family transporter [Deltaproteobacteria bacterium]